MTLVKRTPHGSSEQSLLIRSTRMIKGYAIALGLRSDGLTFFVFWRAAVVGAVAGGGRCAHKQASGGDGGAGRCSDPRGGAVCGDGWSRTLPSPSRPSKPSESKLPRAVGGGERHRRRRARGGGASERRRAHDWDAKARRARQGGKRDVGMRADGENLRRACVLPTGA